MGRFVFTVNVFTVAECPFGKRLPEAIYLFRPAENQVPEGLWKTIRRAEIAAAAGSDWNIIKLHVDGCSITFLQYPGFDTEPHPSLARATKINLKTGSVLQTDYSKRANPPILHRKESFLPPDDPRVAEFAALTRAEEEAGLYREPSTIGLQIQWTTLLRRLG